MNKNNIKIAINEISKGMKKYRKKLLLKRFGKKVFNGWVLDQDILQIDVDELEEPETHESTSEAKKEDTSKLVEYAPGTSDTTLEPDTIEIDGTDETHSTT
jgi:hypothetical protein